MRKVPYLYEDLLCCQVDLYGIAAILACLHLGPGKEKIYIQILAQGGDQKRKSTPKRH
jgi:hypothetical protein